MQSNERLKDIPVIMMSADGEQEQIGECIKCGAKNYLIKPIRIQVKKIFTTLNKIRIIEFFIFFKIKNSLECQKFSHAY